MIRRPPRSTRTDTLFPYTTLFRSAAAIISVVETGIGAHRAQPRHVIEQIAPDRIRTVGEPAGKRLRHRIEQDLRGPDRRGVEEDDARLMDAALFGVLIDHAHPGRAAGLGVIRSEERRGGNEFVSPCISRWSQSP